jgi:glutamate carboxypeptidase
MRAMRNLVTVWLGFVFLFAGSALAQVDESTLAQVQRERASLIDTMHELVSIESGSRDFDGLSRIAEVIAGRLRMLGGDVDLVEPTDIYHMQDTPAQIGRSVVARFRGTGTRRILLLAHMDTVYLKGMLAEQPFRLEGNRAYGLGIADDKHGIALILHTLSVLRAIGFNDYGLITVLINADEEVSSAGSRSLITALGREHDVVFSCESGGDNRVRLRTSGIGAFKLIVRGRAAHAGAAPEQGRNALYELAHQIMQTRDLSDPDAGLKMNWTVATGGNTRNVIPAEAEATADVRVLLVEDYDRIESEVRRLMRNQLIPDTEIDLVFERRRPPLVSNMASRRLAAHAQEVYRELGMELIVDDEVSGGGTDAAFAALETDAPVIEGMGLQTFGAHSNEAEYVNLESVEPRLYLLTRMIMDVALDKLRNN